MSKCYKTSNNKYSNAPPLMADGRHFTDYRPNCLLNNNFKSQSQTLNSYDYKLYLIRNAENIMDLNRKHSFIINGSYECCNKKTDVPEKQIQSCDVHTCNVNVIDDNGVGLGRDFSSTNQYMLGLNDKVLNLKPNKCL